MKITTKSQDKKSNESETFLQTFVYIIGIYFVHFRISEIKDENRFNCLHKYRYVKVHYISLFALEIKLNMHCMKCWIINILVKCITTVFMCMCIFLLVYVSICVRMHGCLVYVYVSVREYMVCVCVRVSAYAFVYICRYWCICVRARVNVCIY